jgi:hypothetical protein
MGQSVVTMAPTTSACAASTSNVLAAVSNMRMWGLQYRVDPGTGDMKIVARSRNKRAQQSCLQLVQSC